MRVLLVAHQEEQGTGDGPRAGEEAARRRREEAIAGELERTFRKEHFRDMKARRRADTRCVMHPCVMAQRRGGSNALQGPCPTAYHATGARPVQPGFHQAQFSPQALSEDNHSLSLPSHHGVVHRCWASSTWASSWAGWAATCLWWTSTPRTKRPPLSGCRCARVTWSVRCEVFCVTRGGWPWGRFVLTGVRPLPQWPRRVAHAHRAPLLVPSHGDSMAFLCRVVDP